MRVSPRYLAAVALFALAGCSETQPGGPAGTSSSSSGSGGPTFGPIGSRTDLPVDTRVTIDNLSAPVDVVRDTWGRPHIYAANVVDAMRVEGWLVAKDRHLQLEFFRRAAEGRLAEILAQVSPSLIDVDISYRHIGLARVAKAQYDAIAPGTELREVLDAYADGITQVFRKYRSGELPLPNGIFGIDLSAFTDWTGVDSLAIGRLQTHLLSYDGDVDVENQTFFDLARSTFAAANPDPLVAKRVGLERDLFRFAPSDPATTTTGYPMSSSPLKLPPPKPTGPVKAPSYDAGAFAASMRGYTAARHLSRTMFNPAGFGSNDWAVAPSRSATGHALVASDPHLNLSAPAVFWPVSMQVKATAGGDATKDLVVAGLSFPGIPGIILGHNEHIAWGATVAGYDVSDAYMETLGADGDSVIFNGSPVKLQTIDEVINIQGKPPLTYHVKVVPQHGPILPNIQIDHSILPIDPKTPTVSIRWTGLEATDEIAAVMGLLRAANVDEARAALRQFGVGAQNWMIGDTSGDVLWTSHANVPIRDPRAFKWNAATYTGTIPCLILPGDGTAEWKGYLPDDTVPWEKNPSAGTMSTANNDPIGDTLDNDPTNNTLPDGTPMYLACYYDIGFREGRIHTLLNAHTAPIAPTDMATIQADVRSALGAALAPALITAIDRAALERMTPGTHPDLTTVVNDKGYSPAAVATVRGLLDAWGKTSDYRASAGIDLDTNAPLPASGASAVEVTASQATMVFNAWVTRFMARSFDDELKRVGGGNFPAFDFYARGRAMLHVFNADPPTLATFDPATQDSALWDDIDTPAVESRYDRMIRALVDALADLTTLAGPDMSTYRWGTNHTVTFTALVSVYGQLSIPPSSELVFSNGFPRAGDAFSVDASDYDYYGLGTAPNFTYAHGPTQRFVVDMDPAGPKAWNTLPGGVIWDSASPHFRDEAELWRRNETHPVPFALADVVAAKESRTVVSSTAAAK